MRKDEPMSAQTDYLRKLGYETSDVSLPTLLKWLGALVIFAGGTAIVTYFIYVVFVPEIGVEGRPFPQANAINLPPEPNPLLQANPHRDIREFREAEEAQLSSYGWVDKKTGTVRIPVARAMDLVLQRGLPKMLPGPAAGSVAPGPSVTTPLPSNPNVPGGAVPAQTMQGQPGVQPTPSTGGAADSEGNSTESPGAGAIP